MFGRIIYFLLIGWWAGTIWGILGYLLCISIIGLPLGLMMLNKLPQVLTLKPYSNETLVIHEYNGTHIVQTSKIEYPFILRALYFFFIGWELTGICLGVALFLCVTVIGLPLGLIIINHIPFLLTLKRNY